MLHNSVVNIDNHAKQKTKWYIGPKLYNEEIDQIILESHVLYTPENKV